jgi:type IV pilus assembly protein PilN
MIKVNLLASDKQRGKKKAAAAFQIGQQLTLVCALILLTGVAFVAWRYWDIGRDGVQLDIDITAAQAESARLRSIISEVQKFEVRKGQLQQRVSLIEQLRKDQTGPVHMLDQISRSMPPMLWLTSLTQDKNPNLVTIDGRCTSQTGVSDFVANLEASGYFKRSVEIVTTQVETVSGIGELIRFSLKAQFQRPGAAAAAAPATPATPAGPVVPGRAVQGN